MYKASVVAKKERHNLVPTDSKLLIELCQELTDNGFIIFLKNPEVLHLSWLVLKKKALLSDVDGKLFAPISFPEYREYGSHTGVIRFSKLSNIFQQYAPNMLFGFLCQMEYCREIKDEEVTKQLLSLELFSKSERYYFFPSAVKVERPLDGWKDKHGYQFGWILEATKGHFSPSFTQILLLRLIFDPTMIECVLDTPLDIHSISTIWKSGVLWSNSKGVDTIVDVIDQNKLLVLMHCSNDFRDKLVSLNHRSSLLKLIRGIKQEICPTVDTSEFFINPEQIEHPLPLDYGKHLTSAEEFSKTISRGDRYLCTQKGDKVKVTDFLFFDPYIYLCSTLSKLIKNPENSHKTVDKNTLSRFANHLYSFFELFVELIGLPQFLMDKINQLPCSTEKFCKLFELWFQRIGTTFEVLKKQLDSMSVIDPKVHGTWLHDALCTLIIIILYYRN